MTNFSIPEVNLLKNSSTLAVSVPINLSIKLSFVFENGPRKLSLWTRYEPGLSEWRRSNFYETVRVALCSYSIRTTLGVKKVIS